MKLTTEELDAIRADINGDGLCSEHAQALLAHIEALTKREDFLEKEVLWLKKQLSVPTGRPTGWTITPEGDAVETALYLKEREG